MTQTLKVRSIVAAVLAPLVLAIGALVLVANQDPPLQKLSVGGNPGVQERSAGDASSDSGFAKSAPMMGMPYGGANYVLAGELPDLADKAPAYRYVREDGAAAAAKVAEALGLKGEPQKRESSWEIRDGSRTLVVNDFPGLPWFLSECVMPDDIANSDEVQPEFSGCAMKAEPVPPAEVPELKEVPRPLPIPEPGRPFTGGGDGEGGFVVPDEVQVVPGTGGSSDPCPAKPLPDGTVYDCGISILPVEPTPYEPVRPEGLPDRQTAEATAHAVFDRLGVSSQDLHLDDGFTSWYAWAPMRIGGFEAQMSTSVAIGVDGVIIGGNGMAGEPEHLGDYPLVSVQAGFERLQQGRLVGHFGTERMARDLPAIAQAVPPPPAPTTNPPFDAPTLPAELGLKRLEEEKIRRSLEAANAEPGSAPGCVPPPVCRPPSDDVAGITKEEFECREFASGQTDGPSPDVCYQPPPSEPPPPYEPPVIKVTGARIVLVQVDNNLVPAYVFEVAPEFGSLTPPVPAVIDDLLSDFAPSVPPPDTSRALIGEQRE